VETGDTYFNEISQESVSGRKQAVKFINRERILKLLVLDKTLEARIEHSRWIVDCPNCNSAEYAFEDGLFFCSQCLNSNVQGKAYRVKIPKERKQIENILSKRAIKNRHWYPKENVKELETENLKHGLEV
jgi:RNase P subunit RPR2